MLAEKNGLKSVLRSPGKSALFLVLLTALTAALALGLCVNSAVGGYLKDCQAYYHTIAQLEYMGAEYPSQKAADEALSSLLHSDEVDLNALTQLPGVLSWEPSRSALALTDDLHRTDNAIYDEDAAVLLINHLSWDKNGQVYMATIQQSLYSKSNTSRVVCFLSGVTREEMTPGTSYVIHGRFITGRSSYLWFLPEEVTLVQQGENVVLPAWQALEDGELPEDSPYRLTAELLRCRNDGLRAELTSDMENLRPFQQEELTLTEGRLLTPSDAGQKLCVLSDRMANQLSVSVGDALPLSLCFGDERGIYESLEGNVPAAEDYEVVGIYGATDDYSDWVFIPDSDDYPAADTPTGYTVGQFRLENNKADNFYEAASELLPAGFRLTILDQGYRLMAEPYQELQRILQIFLWVCALVIGAVLALFGYLFVSRQRETAGIMLALGGGKLHVHRYFAAAAAGIGVPAAILGGLGGRVMEQQVLQFVADFTEKYQTPDIRFSSEYLSMSKTLTFSPKASPVLYVLAGAAMAIGAIFVCSLFAQNAMREKRPKKKRKTRAPKAPAKPSRVSGRLKYTWLSMRRGGMRTASTVLLCMVLSVFLGQLTATADTYQKQLESVEQNTRLRGYPSSFDGMQMDDLVVWADSMQALWDTGLLESLDVSTICGTYRLLGVRARADGTLTNIELPKMPEVTDGFAYETFLNQMSLEPTFKLTTSMTNSPDFYYNPPEITWLEGLDEGCLREGTFDLCVLPDTFLAREGVNLGDVICLRMMGYGDWGNYLYDMDVLVAGSYRLASGGETAYLPLGYTFPMGQEMPEMTDRTQFAALEAIKTQEDALVNYPPSEESWQENQEYIQSLIDRGYVTYSSAILTLKSPEGLSGLRDAAEAQSFSSPKSNNSREWLVLDDKSYNTSVRTLSRQNQYLSALYTFLYVLSGVIAVVLSFLLLLARKKEIATMRGLGAQPTRIFAVFFTEQLILSLLGAGAGYGLWRLTGGAALPLYYLLLIVILVLWCMGTGICTLKLLRSRALAVLSDRD